MLFSQEQNCEYVEDLRLNAANRFVMDRIALNVMSNAMNMNAMWIFLYMFCIPFIVAKGEPVCIRWL